MATAIKDEYAAGRMNVLTAKNSAQLAVSKNFDASVKAHCFFSARVCEARILDQLRRHVDAYLSGSLSGDEAVRALQLYLGGAGYKSGAGRPPPGVSVEEWSRARSVANLASTARLRLLLEQNRRQANAVRRYAEMRDSKAKYLRYVASYSRERRPDHAALVGMVLPADDPFWRGFPRDYGCKCSYAPVWDDDEAAKLGGVGAVQTTAAGQQVAVFGGRRVYIRPNKSGYAFDVGEAFRWCDMSRINDISARRACLESLRDLAISRGIDIHVMPGSPQESPLAVDVRKLQEVISPALDRLGQKRQPDAQEVSVGQLSAAVMESIGLPPDCGKLIFRTSGTEAGLLHRWTQHKQDYISGDYLRVIDACCRAKEAIVTLTMSDKGAEILHIVAEDNMITLRRNIDAGGDRTPSWVVVSWHKSNAAYTGQRQRM